MVINGNRNGNGTSKVPALALTFSRPTTMTELGLMGLGWFRLGRLWACAAYVIRIYAKLKGLYSGSRLRA